MDSSIIELANETDSDRSIEVLSHEHGKTGMTLGQQTPWKQCPSRQKGKKGAKRVTFGGMLLKEFEEQTAASTAKEGGMTRSSEGEQIYIGHLTCTE